MTRLRLARALGVVAVVVLVGVSVVAWRRDGAPSAAAPGAPVPLVLRDPRTGATVEVPRDGWRVEEPRVRIWYADRRGRPVAVVRGPAVFRAGYCRSRPRGSSRAFVGFTRDRFDDWVTGLTGGRGAWSTGTERQRVTLAGGDRAVVTRTGLFLGGRGPCSAVGVEVAMVQARDVRVVLVRDDSPDEDDGTLQREAVEPILTSLRLDARRVS